MGHVWAEILRAGTYIIVGGIVAYAWKLAHDSAKGNKLRHALWTGFLWCGGIALFASLMLGSATCEVQSDPVYGGCDQYADDGYTPTTEQRVANFAYYFTLLYVPVIFGAFSGRKEEADISKQSITS